MKQRSATIAGVGAARGVRRAALIRVAAGMAIVPMLWACGAGPSAPTKVTTTTYTLVSIDGDTLPVASPGGGNFVWGTFDLIDADSAVSEIAVETPPSGGFPGLTAIQLQLYGVHLAGSQIVLTPHTLGDPPDTGTFSPTEIILPRPAVRNGAEVVSQFRFVVQH